MKILIISDDKSFTETLNSFFIQHNHSTIIYKWLIKAMDNLEEIAPQIIIISADEYPRHWKALVQFMESGIAGTDYSVYLYKKEPFSKDDSDKIKTLKINGIFSEYDDSNLKAVFNSLIQDNSHSDFKTDIEIAGEPEKDNIIKDEMVITNPGTHNFVFGNYYMNDEKTISFETNDSCRNLSINDHIKKITYKQNGKYISTGARIKQITRDNDFTVMLLEI